MSVEGWALGVAIVSAAGSIGAIMGAVGRYAGEAVS